MLFLTLFAAVLPATLAVKCYTCSWSPKDAPNRTAMCNDEHFEHNALFISDCPHGCQTYFHKDSNGAIEQVRRSCLQSSSDMTESCITDENIAFSAKRCTCNYNLCNPAATLCASPTAAAVSLLSALWILRKVQMRL